MFTQLRPPLRGLAVALVLAALPMAPAHAQRRSALLSDSPPPAGRRCEVAKRPRALPALAAVVDSAGLLQALAADSALKGAAGSVLLSLRFEPAGALAWARPIEGDLPAGAQARVQGIVQRFLRSAGRQDEPWSVRLRVQVGTAPELRLGRSEICPVQHAPGAVQTMAERLTGQDIAEMNRAGESRIQVRVSPGGQVMDIRVVQSSGSRIMDDMMVRSSRESRFLPELVDGIPVEGIHVIRSRSSR